METLDIELDGNFYRSIIRDPELTNSEKITYIYLREFSIGKGYCTHTDEELKEIFTLSDSGISKRISNLRRKGYIQVETIRSGIPFAERRIYPLK